MKIESTDQKPICDLSKLPDGCISHVIVLTSPRDACVSSAICNSIRSAADCDATWMHFLPSDYRSILSRAVDPVEYSSKKELFFRLCDRPILIDGRMMSFGLHRLSGAKCFMLSAKALYVSWIDDPRYGEWVPLSNSRFSEGAYLLNICWLELIGRIKTDLLTPNTIYAAYLVFKVTSESSYGLSFPPQVSIITIGSTVSEHNVNLEPDNRWRKKSRFWPLFPVLEPHELSERYYGEVRLPREREDGWMEIEMGEFYNEGGLETREVEMRLRGLRGGHWKRGLLVLGMEVRPKN